MCSNKLCHFTSQPFVSSLHCVYGMHNTRPHPCMQPFKQGEWGEWVHLPRGSPWDQSLDVSLKMLPFLHILCLVYTVQLLDNNFITCVKNEHFGRKDFERIFNCLCKTNTLDTTRSHLPHNAPHLPSIHGWCTRINMHTDKPKAKWQLNQIHIVGGNSVETHTVVQEVKKRECERGM